MDLATLCVICGIENGTSGHLLGIFSVDIAFACYFVALYHPAPSTPVEMLVILAMPVKNYLKWQGIQPVIHSTSGA